MRDRENEAAILRKEYGMGTFEIHIISLNDKFDIYRAVLFGCGDGACPQILEIRRDAIRDRFQSVFSFSEEALDKIRERVEADRERTAVVPVKATPEQLRLFGFPGFEAKSA
jgi:hypothetical protein